MGRPPIGKVAMTGAERVRRYRLKHGADKPVTKPVEPVTYFKVAPDLSDVKRGFAPLTKPRRAVTKPAVKLGPLQARIHELAAELDRLKAALAHERLEHEATLGGYRMALEAHEGVWTRKQYDIVLFCLHPDTRANQPE